MHEPEGWRNGRDSGQKPVGGAHHGHGLADVVGLTGIALEEERFHATTPLHARVAENDVAETRKERLGSAVRSGIGMGKVLESEMQLAGERGEIDCAAGATRLCVGLAYPDQVQALVVMPPANPEGQRSETDRQRKCDEAVAEYAEKALHETPPAEIAPHSGHWLGVALVS